MNSSGLKKLEVDEPEIYEINQSTYVPLIAPYAGITAKYKFRPHFALLADADFITIGSTAYASNERIGINFYRDENWTISRFKNIELALYGSSTFQMKNIELGLQYGYKFNYAVSGSCSRTSLLSDYADAYGDGNIQLEKTTINIFAAEDGDDMAANRINHQLFLGLSAGLFKFMLLDFRVSSGNYYSYLICYDSGSWCIVCGDGYSYRKLNYALGMHIWLTH